MNGLNLTWVVSFVMLFAVAVAATQGFVTEAWGFTLGAFITGAATGGTIATVNARKAPTPPGD